MIVKALNASIPYLILCFITILAHFGLIQVGAYYHNSDLAVDPLVAADFLKGQFSAFAFQQDYGGAALIYLRAAYLWMHRLLFPNTYSLAVSNFQFSYLGTPLLMMSTVYFSVAGLVSQKTRFMTALICAIGLIIWDHQYGNDFYFLTLILGIFFIREKLLYPQPFSASLKRQLLWGVLTGLSFYNWRASIVSAVLFYTPWGELKKIIADIFRPQGRAQKTLLGIAIFFLGFYLYLTFFGPDIGKWNDRSIRIHASANLLFSILACGGIALLQNLAALKKNTLSLMVTVSGFFLGFLPEIFYRLTHTRPVPLANWEATWADEFFHTLITKFPVALKELLLGYRHLNSFSGILQNGTLLFWFFSVLSYLVWVRSKKASPIPLYGAVLSIFAFCCIKTYDLGPTRYLMPIFPSLIFAAAYFFENIFVGRTKRFTLMAFILFALHSAYVWTQRDVSRSSILVSNQIQQTQAIIEAFRNAGVSVVITDEYWHSNTYTLLSDHQPHFVSTGRPWGPPEGFLRAENPGLLKGYLVTKKTEFDTQPDQTIGPYRLWIGKRPREITATQ